MPPEQRKRELKVLQAAANSELHANTYDGHRELLAALDALAEWHGSDVHLLADLDQALMDFEQPDERTEAGALLASERAEHRHLAEQLREIGQGTMQEWMRIVDLEDVAGIRLEARVRWQNDDGECLMGESQYSEEYGRFRITVHVEDLGMLPPIGPENDPALAIEQEAEELQWVRRTWADVRAGDRIRMVGTEHTATVTSAVRLGWHVHPNANPYQPNEMPAEWSEIKVLLEHSAELYSKNPAGPIEIELTARELAAIELLGWESRLTSNSDAVE